MSLKIVNAHSGVSFATEPLSYASLDELRTWVSQKCGIQAPNQILMNGGGKQVKMQTLLTDTEIFLYDRSILASSTLASNILPKASQSSSTVFTPDDPPQTSVRAGTLLEWQNIFKQRQLWAQQLYVGSKTTVERILQLDGETSAVQRGAAIAVENIRQHVKSLRPKYEETKAWADQITHDQACILRRWRKIRDALGSILVEKEFAQCLQGGERSIERANTRGPNGVMTLLDFVDEADVNSACDVGENFAQHFRTHVEDLETAFKNVTNNSKEIIDQSNRFTSHTSSNNRDQANHLLEEIEVLSMKVKSDSDRTEGVEDQHKSILHCSKTAQLHTRNLIPSIVQAGGEIAQLLQEAVQRKQNATKTSIHYLQQISLVESKISSMHSKLATLDVDADSIKAFDLLNHIIKLPSVYGSFLVEYIRRCEWNDRALSNPSRPLQNLVQEREQELKRRKQWHKDTEGVMRFNKLGDIGMEVVLGHQRSHDRQPLANREHVLTYIDRLRGASDLQDALRDVNEASRTLFGPARQQSRLSTAFKNGSLHESAYSRNSITSQGDAQSLSELQSEKSKVDEKLKSAESRIRKLEDLLHRQSQAPKPSSAGNFGPSIAPTFERHVTAPITNFTSALSKARDVGSRRSSTSSRRVSQNMEPEERGLAQRIVSLEAELSAQKAQSRDLEKNAAVRQNAEENLKSQAREAIATKEDLLSNLEAQQREFENERRLLEEDKGRLKLQVEDLEDELDRLQDNNVHNDDFYALQDQFEKHKQDAYEREEALRSDLIVQQDRCSSLEQISQQQSLRYTEMESTTRNLAGRLQDRENARMSQHRTLRSSLLRLAHEINAPEDLDALIETLATVAERIADEHKGLQSALEASQATTAEVEARLKSQDDEMSVLRNHLNSAERLIASLRNDLSAKETAYVSLQMQLDSVIQKRDALQSDLTKSDADCTMARQQVLDKQQASERLTDQMTNLQSQLDKLNSHLSEKSDTLISLQKRYDELSGSSNAQAKRAEDVSRRLQLQGESLRRLLEQVGLVVSKQEEGMVIQKIQKPTASASTTLVDPSMSMKRSMSGALPTVAELEALIDSDALHWAKVEDANEAASRYDEFINSTSAFDMKAFNEAIYKRIRDVEHVARKWQREARSYRDKARRAQSEAHERIALRSFKEGDLALFLPTRDQATKPWAAFNVGAPHYFLREQDSHRLGKREWLIARISKVEERVVDLSKSISSQKVSSGSLDEENPYELSDGLRWYLLDAAEEKPGAPINIGMGKATVALTETDKPIKGSIELKKASDGNGATKTLTRSLDSRRSSTNSKKGLGAVTANSTSAPAGVEGMLQRSNSNTSARATDRSSLDVHEPWRPEAGRLQEIDRTDVAQKDPVGTIRSPNQ